MSGNLSPEQEISALVEQYSNSGLFTHAYIEVGSLDKSKSIFQLKHLPDGKPIFDLASLTKALVTTVLAFDLEAKGILDFDAPLRAWLPETFRPKFPKELLDLTCRELLAHRSGLPAWRNFYVNRLNPKADLGLLAKDSHDYLLEFFHRSAPWDLSVKRDVYSDVGFILLGFGIELATGKKLLDFFSEIKKNILFSEGQGYFGFSEKGLAGAIRTGFCAVRGRDLEGEVYDENAAALGGVAGHAGLFGDGESVSLFLRQLASHRLGHGILEDNYKLTATQKDGGLLGWRQGGDENSNPFGGGRAIGHLGFTGTAFWIDLPRRLFSIILTNRTVSGRVSNRIKNFRKKILTQAALFAK